MQVGFEIKKDPKRIHILGTGSGWELAPKATSATVYCLNDYIRVERYGIRPDRLFIMDILDSKPQIISGQDDLGAVIKRINDMGVPLVAPMKYEEIPLSEAFPLDRYVKEFGAPYFLNTIAYMIAYALLEGAEEIDLFGINQASSSEYFYEKASCEYLLGVAIGRGVKVTIHGEKSELLMNKARFGGSILYGYDASYETIKRDDQRFGEGVVKKLMTPPKAVSRTVRQIK